jgi:hypothetical protein
MSPCPAACAQSAAAAVTYACHAAPGRPRRGTARDTSPVLLSFVGVYPLAARVAGGWPCGTAVRGRRGHEHTPPPSSLARPPQRPPTQMTPPPPPCCSPSPRRSAIRVTWQRSWRCAQRAARRGCRGTASGSCGCRPARCERRCRAAGRGNKRAGGSSAGGLMRGPRARWSVSSVCAELAVQQGGWAGAGVSGATCKGPVQHQLSECAPLACMLRPVT